MADPAGALAALRGLHMPAAASTTAGDVALAVAVGLALALLLFAIAPNMARREQGARRAALELLAGTRDLPPPHRLAAQAELLRRLVRAEDGEEAAGLQGEDWRSHLDRRFRTTFFSDGAGLALIADLYRPAPDIDPAAIDAGLAGLLRRR